jgi:hypothetical protein
MSKHYKAATKFSFGGKAYEEGQAVNIADEDAIAKLKERKQITSGEGTSDEDLEAEAQKAEQKKRDEADKKREQEAFDREKEYLDRQSKPKSSARFKVDDQTGSEKVTTSGPNAPKKS